MVVECGAARARARRTASCRARRGAVGVGLAWLLRSGDRRLAGSGGDVAVATGDELVVLPAHHRRRRRASVDADATADAAFELLPAHHRRRPFAAAIVVAEADTAHLALTTTTASSQHSWNHLLCLSNDVHHHHHHHSQPHITLRHSLFFT